MGAPQGAPFVLRRKDGKMEELLAKAEELKKLLDEINDVKEKFLDGMESEEAQRALKYAMDFKTNSCLRYVTFSENGEKYLVLINTKDGSNICFRVDSIALDKSKVGDSFHPEELFTE